MTKQEPLKVQLSIGTVFVVIVAVFSIRLIEAVSPVLLPIFISALIAVALYPLVAFMEKRGAPEWLAVTTLTTIIAGGLIGVVSLVIPRIYQELTAFVDNFPKFKSDILASLSPNNPLREFLNKGFASEKLLAETANFQQLFAAGNLAIGGIIEILLILILTIYLVSDGPRMIVWISAFFSPKTQAKLKETSSEVSKIVFAYISGQFITSTFAFFFVLISLIVLDVPGALFLAVLAGLLDVIPVLGFVLSVIPAMLFALRVSPTTPLIVFALYIFYHAIENYYIIPLVYGKRLRVSSFVVFVSLLFAGLIAGIEGAVTVLPLVASYPIIERIWLNRYLGTSTIAAHEVIESKHV